MQLSLLCVLSYFYDNSFIADITKQVLFPEIRASFKHNQQCCDNFEFTPLPQLLEVYSKVFKPDYFKNALANDAEFYEPLLDDQKSVYSNCGNLFTFDTNLQ